jgi:hypothetical protein
MAARHPELVIELILVNAIVGEHWDERIAEIRPVVARFADSRLLLVKLAALVAAAPKLAPIIGHLLLDSAKMLRNSRRDDPSVSRAGLSLWFNHVLRPDRLLPAGIAILTADPTTPLLKELRTKSVPVVVLYGVADPVVTWRDALSVRELTGGRLILVQPANAQSRREADDHGHSWLLGQSDTLAGRYGIMDVSLRGGPAGELLKRDVAEHGLDPHTATQADIEQSEGFYAKDALIHQLTPALSFRRRRQSGGPAYWTTYSPVA